MVKTFGVVFTTDDPSAESGLVPVFDKFKTISGTSVAVPTISELGSDGLYYFTATLLANELIYFVMDGATTGLGGNRYVSGMLDPADAIDVQTTNFSSTMTAVLGATTSAIGDDSTAPADMWGYLMRLREWLEGDGEYNKATGAWTQKNIAGTTTLSTKTLADGATIVSKT